MIRAAKIRLVRGDKRKFTNLRRPIQHLIPLELHMEPKSASPLIEEIPTAQQTDIQTNTRRPRRTAAVIGELVRKGQ